MAPEGRAVRGDEHRSGRWGVIHGDRDPRTVCRVACSVGGQALQRVGATGDTGGVPVVEVAVEVGMAAPMTDLLNAPPVSTNWTSAMSTP